MATLPKKSSWKKRLPWIAFLLVLVGGGLAYWRYVRAHPPPPITFKTAPIEKRKIVARVTASGTLSALVTVQVGSQVSGRHAEAQRRLQLAGEEGGAHREDRSAALPGRGRAGARELRVRRRRASCKARGAGRRDADRSYEPHARRCSSRTSPPQADLDTARDERRGRPSAGIDVAKASLAQAKASLNQAQVNLSYTSIISPIDGVVISRSVDVGQTVAASLQAPMLFTIAEDLSKMQVDTNVAEGDVGRLRAGMAANFTVDAYPGERFNGQDPPDPQRARQTVQNVVTYDAVIDVDNAELQLTPGHDRERRRSSTPSKRRRARGPERRAPLPAAARGASAAARARGVGARRHAPAGGVGERRGEGRGARPGGAGRGRRQRGEDERPTEDGLGRSTADARCRSSVKIGPLRRHVHRDRRRRSQGGRPGHRRRDGDGKRDRPRRRPRGAAHAV